MLVIQTQLVFGTIINAPSLALLLMWTQNVLQIQHVYGMSLSSSATPMYANPIKQMLIVKTDQNASGINFYQRSNASQTIANQ